MDNMTYLEISCFSPGMQPIVFSPAEIPALDGEHASDIFVAPNKALSQWQDQRTRKLKEEHPDGLA